MFRIALGVLLLLPVIVTRAQDANTVQFVAVVTTPDREINNALNLYTFDLDEGRLVDMRGLEEAPFFYGMAWSDDGSRLAYIRYFQTNVEPTDTSLPARRDQLFLWDFDALSLPVLLIDDADSTYPPAFTDDGRVIYARDTGEMIEVDNFPRQLFDVVAITPNDPQGEIIGSALYGAGCGGGTNLPTIRREWQEAGYEGGLTLLERTPAGILYTAICLRTDYGLGTTEGADTLVTGLEDARLSPDRSRLAGIGDDGLTIIDVVTGEATIIETAEAPHRLGWGADGMTVIYASRERLDALDLDDDDRARVEARFTDLLPQAAAGRYTLRLHRLDLVTSDETLIHETEGYAVGRISGLSNGGFFFSRIGSLEPWMLAQLNETIDTTTAEGRLEEFNTVALDLMYVSPTGEVTLIAPQLGQHVIRP